MVTGRELNTYISPASLRNIEYMLYVARFARYNWPEYRLWAGTTFHPRTIATMAINCCFWLENTCDFYQGMQEHLDIEGQDLTFATDAEALHLIDTLGMFFENLPFVVYGFVYPDDNPGMFGGYGHQSDAAREYWVFNVIQHIFGDQCYRYDPDVAQFPVIDVPKRKIAGVDTPDAYFFVKIAAVLATSERHAERQLAAVITYIYKSVGLDVADYSMDEMFEAAQPDVNWLKPDYIRRSIDCQRMAMYISDLYEERCKALAFNPSATLDFLLPLYGAAAVVKANDAAAAKAAKKRTLMDTFNERDRRPERQPTTLYGMIFTEDTNDGDQAPYLYEWLGITWRYPRTFDFRP